MLASDVLEDPRALLEALCEALGVPFRAEMLSWGRAARNGRGVGDALVHGGRGVDDSSRTEPNRTRREQEQLMDGCRTCYAQLYPHPLEPERSPVQQKLDEKNRDLIVNINGKLVHRDQAGVSPFDSAVQGGDAVWEGLRLYDGRIFKLREHLDRLRGSALALAFAEIPSHEAIIGEIRRTLEANGMRDGVHIRLTLTRGVKITSGMDPD